MLEWRQNLGLNICENEVTWVLLFHIRLKNPLDGVVRMRVVEELCWKNSHTSLGNNWDEVFFLIKLWSETNNFTIIGFLNKFFLCEFCEVFESFSFTRRGVSEHCQRSNMEFIMKIVHGNYFHKKLYLRF